MSDTIGMFGETQWGSGPAVQATRLDEGAMFADRYEIKRELGAGGMGVVYLAQDTLTNREIVLKLIHPSLVDERAAARMIEEGVLASQIRHPNVVAVHHIDRVDGQTFLTMEYVEGKTLRQWIGENVVSQRETPVDQAVAVVREILKGLSAAHAAGIVHRDLKPENILLTGDPGAGDFGLKILDFGIARGFKTEVFTSSTPAMGTPLYMAPEQKTMPDAAGPSADLYSVGRIFYELLMDVLPDGASSPPSEQRQDLPKALDAVLAKAANTRPKARYQSAEEFMAAIDAAVAKPVEPEEPVVPEKIEKKPEPEEKKTQSEFEENKEKIRQGLMGLLPKDKKWRIALYVLLGFILLAAIMDEMDSSGSFDTGSVIDSGGVRTAGFDNGGREVVRGDQGGGSTDVSLGQEYRQQFQSFQGVEYAWREDATQAVYRVKQNNSGEIAGYGVSPEYGEIVVLGSVDGADIYRLSNGEPVGLLSGQIGLQPSGGYDFVGTLDDYRSGASEQVRFHINH